MNYLAHAWPFMQSGEPDPYELAGVAVPDWLGVAARRTKCRSRHAEPLLGSSDDRLAALARGICRHHADDARFHESATFGKLSLGFAKRLREAFGESTSMRPWFLGHILVELLLDDELAWRYPTLLDRYYSAVGKIDSDWVATAVQRMCGRDVGKLTSFINRYVELRFLFDYRTDEGLSLRMNQVMARVGLDELPSSFAAVLPTCRNAVGASFEALLFGENVQGT